MRIPRRIALFLCLLFLLLSACGKKGPVRPLGLPLPQAPEALSLRQIEESFLLSWTIPEQNLDGSALLDLAGFRIYRMRYIPGEECPECRDTSVLWEQVDLNYLQQARRVDDRLYLWDRTLIPEYGYAYRIVPVTSAGREGAPAVIQQPVLPPLPAPENLTAVGYDRMVRLTWDRSDSENDGRITGYDVYRRLQGEPPPLSPLNPAPLEELLFEDYSVENGRTYLYSVRALFRQEGMALESAEAGPVTAMPTRGQ